MKYRNKLAGGQIIVVPAYNCGIWIKKPITSWAEKIAIINNIHSMPFGQEIQKAQRMSIN